MQELIVSLYSDPNIDSPFQKSKFGSSEMSRLYLCHQTLGKCLVVYGLTFESIVLIWRTVLNGVLDSMLVKTKCI